MLSVSDLTAAYGSVPVLNGVSLSLAKGEVLALLGRNGVGKTTLLRTLTGLLPPLSGQVELDGVAIAGLPTHAISRMGVALVPQGRGIFAKLSVRENLVAGGRAAKGRGAVPLDEILRASRRCATGSARPAARYRAASSSSLRSRGRFRRGRTSCCSTSPRRASSPTSCTPSQS